MNLRPLRLGRQSSEFQVNPHSGGQHRAAVAVVARMVDALDVEAAEHPAPYVRVVVTLDNILAAVIQRTVAEQESHSTQGEVMLVVGRDAV